VLHFYLKLSNNLGVTAKKAGGLFVTNMVH